MREIKFRAWDGKEMHLPEYSDKEDFHILADGSIVYTHEVGYERHEYTDRRGDNWIIMQYIGEKDKNGIDIYEGDILCGDGYGDHKCVVEWVPLICGFKLKFKDGKFGHIADRVDYLCVIGNIYKNTI